MLKWLLFIGVVLPLGAVADDDIPWVDLGKIDFSIKQDIRYATKNNFTGKVLYPEAKCALRKPVAIALARVQAALKLAGYGLKVWDCYRPSPIQDQLWKIKPDEKYVANPQKGSVHSRGGAVDVTLLEANGNEAEMPTAFDDFTPKAHRDSKRWKKVARKNSRRLEAAMVKEGFIPFPTEWWHYDFKGADQFALSDTPLSAIK
jgi:D-alanyl-D-alanine dipeptidase